MRREAPNNGNWHYVSCDVWSDVSGCSHCRLHLHRNARSDRHEPGHYHQLHRPDPVRRCCKLYQSGAPLLYDLRHHHGDRRFVEASGALCKLSGRRHHRLSGHGHCHRLQMFLFLILLEILLHDRSTPVQKFLSLTLFYIICLQFLYKMIPETQIPDPARLCLLEKSGP